MLGFQVVIFKFYLRYKAVVKRADVGGVVNVTVLLFNREYFEEQFM